ncbi:MAG: hypothetical protein R3C11_27985 [Planctomycetaceae bacterium]
MIRHSSPFFVLTTLSALLTGLAAGCSEATPPEKTSLEKLDTEDPAEKKAALEEIQQKYDQKTPAGSSTE